VYCDHYYVSTNRGSPAESCYIGAFAKGEATRAILKEWPDGGYAEKMVLPAECFTPLGPAGSVDPAILVRLGWFGTCHGAYLRAGLRPGQRVVVNAATGLVGTCGVLLALAMGAARVVAVGRRKEVLEELARIDPLRVATVTAEAETEAIAAAAGGGADLVLDCVGDISDPASTTNALRALAPFGTAVLVGGLNADLPLNAKWVLDQQVRIMGSSWFPRHLMGELAAMIGNGALAVDRLSARTFPLDRVNEAVALAAKGLGGLTHVALVP
ncbi:MAG: zinc-binding dehydrogenase, partial [Alphaproteobacteria bacterium]